VIAVLPATLGNRDPSGHLAFAGSTSQALHLATGVPGQRVTKDAGKPSTLLFSCGGHTLA